MMEVATLGGGCFWCTEAVFAELQGVEKAESGYSGGHLANPTYEAVCSGRTGHAEVSEITFDPDVLSYDDLLRIFFTVHDPTTLNRQGADVGTQYRSVIFTHSPEQERIAREVIDEITAAGIWADPIVTEVSALRGFSPAEAYHKDYYRNNPDQGYCRVVIAPKVSKFRKQYYDRLKRTAVA